MALAAKLLFLKCIKPKSMKFKMSILHYQFTDVGMTSNKVPYTRSGSSLYAPKSSASSVNYLFMLINLKSLQLEMYLLILISLITVNKNPAITTTNRAQFEV
jgi:hypothetical protein